MADIILRNDNKTIKLTTQQKTINLKHTSAPVHIGSNNYNDLINKPDLSVYATKIYVDTSLSGKAEVVHVHTISNVTGLQTALDEKANKVHTHVATDITDFNSSVSSNSDVSANTAARHTHANKTILDATSAAYTTADETKLDGIESGAQVNTVTSVAGKTGTVTLNKADVGLSNVDNTSDADKPVSTAQQTALNAKANSSETVSLTGDQTVAGVKTFSGTTNFSRLNVTNSSTLADASKLGSSTAQIGLYANNGGGEVFTTNGARLRFGNQVRFDSSNFNINTPPLVFRNDADDDSAGSKGSIVEWQQYFTSGSKDVGIATNAYWNWIRGGAVGSRPTFNITSAGAKRVSWLMTHYDSPSTTGEDIHQHFNIETAMADMATIITRFQISYGEDVALVSFPNAHIQVFDDKLFRWSSNSNVYTTWNSASQVLQTIANYVKYGDNTSNVKIELAGQNGSATGGTLQFSESSGAAKNGVSFVYDSANNQLRVINDSNGATTVIFNRDGGMSLQGFKINSLATPTSSNDAANKSYVDTGGWSPVPASASATGTAGQKAYDSSYIYICTATNTWKRSPLTAW